MINKQNLMSKKAQMSYAQILILIISSFAFAYLIYSSVGLVSAQTNSVQCCEETNNGHLCQEFLARNIEENCKGTIFPGQCKDFANCGFGCCYDSEEGICSANSPKRACDGVWKENAFCNIKECEKGCCVLGNEIKFTTQQRCNELSSHFGLEPDFQSEIKTELECIFLAEKDDEGACVLEPESILETKKPCVFTTRENCVTRTGSDTNFYKNIFCSDQSLGTNCVAQDNAGCVEGKDEVYWFDSCGNPEEIKEECSIFTGTICRQYRPGLDEKPDEGDYVCRSLDCKTKDGIKENGESWCVYDGTIGDGKDVVGSRHIKHVCYMGEEKIEPCSDFRNEICVQSNTELDNREIFSEAACRVNRWRECTEINLEEDAERKKERCEKNIDCQYGEVSIDKNFRFPFCTPKYPPGFDLKNRPEDANLICGQATQKCIAVKVKKLSGWKWVANKQCTEMVFTEKMNDYCRSLGDCGAYVNILGEYDQGFYIGGDGKAPNYLSQTKINEYKNYARPKPGQKPAEPGELSELIERSLEYSDGETPMPTTEILTGSTIGGIGAITFLHSLELGGYFVGGKVSALADKFPYAGKAVAGAEVPKGWAGFGNALSGSLGAAAGTYIAMRLGGGLPSDAAAIVSIMSSIVGAIAGASAVAGVTASLTLAEETYITAQSGVITEGGQLVQSGLEWLSGSGSFEQVKAAGAGLNEAATTLGNAHKGLTTAQATQGMSKFITGFVNAFIWAIIIAGIMIGVMKLLGIGKTKKYVIEFHCLPWQAPTGGKNCDKCNTNDPLDVSCSEYRCSSLGQACEFLNKGTEDEKCSWINPHDVSSPKISPLFEEITMGYEYYNIQNNGFEVVESSNKSCIPEFTKIIFGIKTDKPAQCKIGNDHMQNYGDMQEYFGGSNSYITNHTTILNTPSPQAFANQYNLTDKQIEELGEINYYIKCKSANGVVNSASYTIRSCIEPGDDLTAPRIERTIPISGAPIKFNAIEQDLDVWINEPANCKYSSEDKDYELMENSMECKTDFEDYGLFGWPCNTTLTGIEIKNELPFHFVYIKCQDISENKNTMTEGYPYVLLLSDSELIIEEFRPIDGAEIFSGVEPVTLRLQAKTSGGAEDGKAECYYDLGSGKIRFFDTYSNYHKQLFNSLTRGRYNIDLRCEDIAENVATASTSFKVSVDITGPRITRIYYEGGLKIWTDEEAECRYDFTKIFNWEDATSMTGFGLEHTADWQLKTYYIQCEDEYGNKGGKMSVKGYGLV